MKRNIILLLSLITWYILIGILQHITTLDILSDRDFFTLFLIIILLGTILDWKIASRNDQLKKSPDQETVPTIKNQRNGKNQLKIAIKILSSLCIVFLIASPFLLVISQAYHIKLIEKRDILDAILLFTSSVSLQGQENAGKNM
jgi:ABC-type Na+ efflux pump permease subunit